MPRSPETVPKAICNLLGSQIVISKLDQGKVAHTVKLTSETGDYVLKTATSAQSRIRLLNEMEFLLKAKISDKPDYSVPSLIASHHSGTWLLLEWIEGQNFRTILYSETSKPRIKHWIREYAKALRWIHGVNLPNGLKTETHLNRKLQEVDRNIDQNWVNQADMEPENQNTPISELREKLTSTIPDDRKKVMIHGDAASDNFIVQNDIITGIIDWSEAGYGDPYADLALAWREMMRLDQPRTYWDLFSDTYGLDYTDRNRINFYLLLDEFM